MVKWADKVLGKGLDMKSAPMSEDNDEDETVEAGEQSDDENGRMFRSAFKSGNNSALCEAIRKICG